ncbi:MAG: hypothetical protein D6731_24690, partial [Planctomycetota bacterium]
PAPGARAQARFFVGSGLWVSEARSVAPGADPRDPAAWSIRLDLAVLRRGARLYTDRGARFLDTAPLTGLPYLRTRDADAGVPGDRFLRFRVSRPVTVTVAYDARASWLPAWLHGWRRLGRRLGTSDGARELFARDFPAGWVVLGGNQSPGARSMYVPIIEERGASAQVGGLRAASGKSYALGRLVPGERLYVDRRYTIQDVGRFGPRPLLIRTANDDKGSRASDTLSFDVAEDVTVLVLYDDRARSLPSWLAGWQRLGWKVRTSDTPRRVYARDFGPGRVVLGGNAAPGVESMYSVVVVPRAQRPPP